MAATLSFAGVADFVDSIVTPKVPGAAFDCIIEATFSNGTYTTAGLAFGNAQLQAAFGGAYSGIWFVDVADPMAGTAPPITSAYLAHYDRVNKKIQLFGSAAVAGAIFPEVANSVNVNGVVVRLRVRFY